ncbi:hypothetical protein KKF64_00085 [Patescibacteria group bacterium]|nr:hypothetical protein [Patescibacteria group bacterium]
MRNPEQPNPMEDHESVEQKESQLDVAQEEESALKVGEKVSIKGINGELFEGCTIKDYKENKDLITVELPDGKGDVYMRRSEFLEAVKNAQTEAVEVGEPKTIELQSRDASKYKAGQRFDNGRVRGTIRIIDFMHNKISVELD